MSSEETARPLSKSAQRGPVVRFLRKYALQLGIFAVALIVWVLFLIGAPRTFLSKEIYISFMSTTPFFALMAIPLTLVVITGEIDLSFGYMYGLASTASSTAPASSCATSARGRSCSTPAPPPAASPRRWPPSTS